MAQTLHRDYQAGARLTQLREDRGLSARDLAYRLSRNANPRLHVSERTIYRIERDGVIPTVRIKFALAAEFGFLPSDIWRPAGLTVQA